MLVRCSRMTMMATRRGIQTKLSLANTAVGLGAASNIFLSASKGYIGYSIGSTALVADAANSLGDLLSDVVVYYSLNAARQGTSEHKPWGLGKIEPLGALSVGVLLLGTGGGVCYSAISSIMEITTMDGAAVATEETGELMSYYAVGITLASMAIKESLYHVTLRAGRSANSDAVIANAYQHRADVLLSSAVLCGLVGSMMGVPVLDPLAGVIVAGVIIRQGATTVVSAIKDLIDSPADAEETRALVETCRAVPGVKAVALKARKSGPYLFVEVKVGVNGSMSASAAHRAAELTRQALLERHGDRVANALVHVDPIGASGMGDLAPAQSRDHQQVLREVEKSLGHISEILSVSEVQLYYADDGSIRIKVDVFMDPAMTIRDAHLIAIKVGYCIDRALHLPAVM